MEGESALRVEGTVAAALPNGMFEVLVPEGGRVIAHVSGKVRMGFVRLLAGDRVTVELSPYDLGRGRITGRVKDAG